LENIFKKGQNKTLSENEESRKEKKNNTCKNQPCDTKLKEKEGRKCSRYESRDFPAALGDTMVQKVLFPCSLWKGPCQSRYLKTAAHGGPRTGLGICTEGSCSPWRGPTLEQRKSVRRKGQQRGTVTD